MATGVTTYAPGTFCWVDLATTDTAGARQFYGSLFGWTAGDTVDVGEPYTMLFKDGKDVAAMHPLHDNWKAINVPSHWMSYVLVSDIGASTDKAQKLGAQVLVPPMDVLDSGRLSVLMDPAGATFSLWQAGKHAGAGLVNEPGSFCWNELMTPDPAKVTPFYTGLFGWTTRTQDMGPAGDYTLFLSGEKMQAGMMGWTQSPPSWLVYFTVENCDQSAEKAGTLGATVVSPPMDIPNVGRFAVIRDPQGAYFAIIQMPKKT